MAGPPRMKNYVLNPPWPKARADRLALDDHRCQANLYGVMTVCDFSPTGELEVHHRLPRGRGGRNDLDNLVTLCPGHHRWVETERAAAKERGLLL